MLSLPFPLRFLLATNPALIGRVLGIVHRVISGHLIRQAGYTQQSACTGAVTLIQRLSSALNLNIHFHMLFLDGVYVVTPPYGNRPRFQWVREPTSAQLTQLAHTIARRGRANKPKNPEPLEDRTPAKQSAAMRWAQRLKRVFQIDVETCPNCGGSVKIIACTRDGFAQVLFAFGKPPHHSRLR